MKIVLTGATGFVGRHMLPLLTALKNVEVTTVVRNPQKLGPLKNTCSIVEYDIFDQTCKIPEELQRADVVLHLAWGGLPNYKSLFHFEEELPSHYQFLAKMVRAGTKSVVVVGTCFEYGMQSGALTEDQPTMPNNPYGFAKDTLRRQLEFLQTKINFKLTWARLFYMYGEGQPENTIYTQLCMAVQNKEPVFNMSGGEQLRDYLHIDDIAHILCRLTAMNKNCGIVNVCSGKPVSIRSLVEKWIVDNGWRIELNLGHYPYPDYEPMAFWGDITKLDTILDLG